MINTLLTRRSVPAKVMTPPGPNREQLSQILQAAHRVPDHGKLGPWRFVVFEGQARETFGQALADIYRQNDPEASEALLEFQANLLLRAPCVIAVISTAKPHAKIPEWEQVMSAGAACQNLLVAAVSLGYGAQWLTEWYSYDAKVAKILDMAPTDNIAGFIYIGNSEQTPEERVRPSLKERILYWE